MPLDLVLAPSPGTVTQRVVIDEHLLWKLPEELGVHAPIWTKLGAGAFDDPELTMREVEALAAEVRVLRQHWLASHRERVIRERHINARDYTTRMELADKVLAERADPTRDLLDRVAALCEAALIAGVGLIGLSD
ncbi:MAG TPA: hypothetical protein VM261_28015 [Kofleriaceae bacterium]|nr:hypothetical protein [Kofleriaceae bacterium]